MYNPFRAHIVYNEDLDKWAIRKIIPIFGTVFLDNTLHPVDNFWWQFTKHTEFYTFDTRDKAQERLDIYRRKKVKDTKRKWCKK